MSITNMDSNIGYLKLIIGPMFAGKSTELLRIINMYKILNKKILIINHNINKRYDQPNSSIVTHDRNKIDNCLAVTSLNEISDEFIGLHDVIIIEELQFFEDAYINIVKMVDDFKKHVICAGLDGDFNRQPFGDVLRLIPHCDDIVKLKALCKKCGDGTPALFSKRIVNNDKTTLVGSNDCYEAVCRMHYLE
jgi:thymidine kinase